MRTSERAGNSRPTGAGGDGAIGLCVDCVHVRPMTGRHSLFVRCGLEVTDERYPRYPMLPVISCRGFSPRPEGA